MKPKEIYAIIDTEITWCIKHPDKALSTEYQKGFRNGLIQAKYLVQKLQEIQYQGNKA